jgi:hypothetical protein
VLLGGIFSSTRQAIKQPAVVEGETLYIYPEQYEGQEYHPLLFCTGASRWMHAFRAKQGGDQPGRMRLPQPKQVSEQGTVSRSRIPIRDGLVSCRTPGCGTVRRQRGENRLTFRRLAPFKRGVLFFGVAHQQQRNA